MALATLIGVALTASGLRGMADAAAQLQRVHDERMVPVRTLSDISRLMWANQHALQLALVQTPRQSDPGSAPGAAPPASAAQEAAQAIAANARAITVLWQTYPGNTSANTDASERLLIQRFTEQRDIYLRDGLHPALAALQSPDANGTSRHGTLAHELHAQAQRTLQALIALQFSAAQHAYEQGMADYAGTRNRALLALPVAALLLGLLGWGQIRAITLPLRRVRHVFRQIARGHLDTPIVIPGRDEISLLLRDLQTLQTRLADNEREIHTLIYRDPLTGLPNRRMLRQSLAEAQADVAAPQAWRALMLLDLDHFKTLNDTLGHDVGDQYLREVARRLATIVRPPDSAARIGGDEFAVLTSALPGDLAQATPAADELAERLRLALAQPWRANQHEHRASVSIGMYLFQPGSASIAELLKRADLAMYEAKSGGRNRVCHFEPHMQAALQRRTVLGAALHEAADAGQLSLHLQPLIDACGQTTGAEALLRWHHPLHGSVPPAEFIALAEANATILPIGAWVLQHGCDQLRLWQDDPATRHMELALNVSLRQFQQPDFVQQVLQALERSGAQPRALVLEITESVVMQDASDTIAKMQALSQRGVRFALDDFGTGYSSLARLRDLPLHLLKIDRSFVHEIAEGGADATLVQAIVGLAQGLGLKTIAEGVETHAQHAALHALGCSFFQGYLFARPMPQAPFAAWLTRSEPAFTPMEDTPS